MPVTFFWAGDERGIPHRMVREGDGFREEVRHQFSKEKTMPHDANNNALSVGDEVVLRAKITQVQPFNDYCNITIESIHGRKPDGQKETVSAINAAVLEKVPDPGQPIDPA